MNSINFKPARDFCVRRLNWSPTAWRRSKILPIWQRSAARYAVAVDA